MFSKFLSVSETAKVEAEGYLLLTRSNRAVEEAVLSPSSVVMFLIAFYERCLIKKT